MSAASTAAHPWTMGVGDNQPFSISISCVRISADGAGEVAIGVPEYSSRRSGVVVRGSWHDVAQRLASDASTSTHGSVVSSIDTQPHPKPAAATRIRELKEQSGLTWDQLRRLFGVSRRAVHAWASGTRMRAGNEERLSELEQVVAALNATDPEGRRHELLSSSNGGGRSHFQRLMLEPRRSEDTDVSKLIESSGDGLTHHGEFLFAESIDDEMSRLGET